MNPAIALQTIIASSKQHPWLLILVGLGFVAHWADMNWPGYHLSYISKGLYGFALIYAGGSSAPIQPPTTPETPAQTSQIKT